MTEFTDKSTAEPIEKARRFLRSLADGNDFKYFFDDGFPRYDEIAQDAIAALEVLEGLTPNE